MLLRSASSDWPDGLANASGLVGRNLMRHYIDLYAVFLKAKDGLGGGQKELAFNDEYLSSSGKAGTVQAFGALPPAPILVADMERDLRRRTHSLACSGLQTGQTFPEAIPRSQVLPCPDPGIDHGGSAVSGEPDRAGRYW